MDLVADYYDDLRSTAIFSTKLGIVKEKNDQYIVCEGLVSGADMLVTTNMNTIKQNRLNEWSRSHKPGRNHDLLYTPGDWRDLQEIDEYELLLLYGAMLFRERDGLTNIREGIKALQSSHFHFAGDTLSQIPTSKMMSEFTPSELD